MDKLQKISAYYKIRGRQHFISYWQIFLETFSRKWNCMEKNSRVAVFETIVVTSIKIIF